MTSPKPPTPDATPSAKELAKARGVNLADVTYKGARITKPDIEACIRSRADAAAAKADADAPSVDDTPAVDDTTTDDDIAADDAAKAADADPDAAKAAKAPDAPADDPAPPGGPGANTAYIVVAEMMLNGARYPTGSRLVLPAAAAGAMLRRGQLRLAD